jgi:hypothetical protein
MSEEHSAGAPQDRDPSLIEPGAVEPGAAEPQPATIGETRSAIGTEATTPAQGASRSRLAVLWLALLLALVVAGIALSPFWASALAPLLPWGAEGSPPAANYTALDTRVSALDTRVTALADRVPTLANRVAALEARPAPSATDVDAVRAAQAAQAQRLDRLAAALAADRPDQAAVTTNAAALQQLTRRVAVIETQAAGKAAENSKEQQQLERLGDFATDLGDRLSALERQIRAQGLAGRAGPALLLAVEQMRQAVEQGRPFRTAYGTFSWLARSDPTLTGGASPLAEAARDGVPSRAALRRGLTDLAGKLSRTTSAPAATSSWWQQALDRTRGLVTIRRIGVAGDSGPRTAVDAARAALADDDLGAAIAALGGVGGAEAEAAKPWLRMARTRLAAEAALAHLQDLLAVRLGATAVPPAAPAAGQDQAPPAVAPPPPTATPSPPAANPNPAPPSSATPRAPS